MEAEERYIVFRASTRNAWSIGTITNRGWFAWMSACFYATEGWRVRVFQTSTNQMREFPHMVNERLQTKRGAR